MNVLELRKELINTFIENDIASTEASAEVDLLIEHFLKLEKKSLFAYPERKIDTNLLSELSIAIEARIKKRVPVQYLVGYTHFYGIKLRVNSNALIPRADTELLVEKSLDLINKNNSKLVVDAGTGSGNISVALLKNCPVLKMIATDISQQALDLAFLNVKEHHLEERVTFLESNMLEKITVPLDGLVSNPPYILKSDASTLKPEVKKHEPVSALFTTAEDPLENYRIISKQAQQKVIPGGFIAVEIDFKQANNICNLFQLDGWQNIQVFSDLNNLPRVITGCKNS